MCVSAVDWSRIIVGNGTHFGVQVLNCRPIDDRIDMQNESVFIFDWANQILSLRNYLLFSFILF